MKENGGSKISYVICPDGRRGVNWNFVYGCTPISSGCANCWSSKLHDARYKALKEDKIQYAKCWTKPFSEVNIIDDRFSHPKTWSYPRTAFVCSGSDLFHEDVPNDIIERAFGIMRNLPQHNFILLTKRSGRMKEYINEFEEYNYGMASNIFLGVTIEAEEVQERFTDMRETNWNHFWISFEPLLSDIPMFRQNAHAMSSLKGMVNLARNRIRGVVVGGESDDRNCRPMCPEWVYAIKEVCDEHNIDFYFKQWGYWFPAGEKDHSGTEWSGAYMPENTIERDGVKFWGRGRRYSGHLLDGHEYVSLPWTKVRKYR